MSASRHGWLIQASAGVSALSGGGGRSVAGGRRRRRRGWPTIGRRSRRRCRSGPRPGQTAASMRREQDRFVLGIRYGLMEIEELSPNDVGRLTGNETGLGLDVHFGEYHTLGPVARGRDNSPGDKHPPSVPSLRWVCRCCLQRPGTPFPKKLVPTVGAKAQEAIIAKYYPQLHRFQEDSGYRDAVVAAVHASWPESPDAVIAHSMGTVVALSALAHAPESKQPTLFVTLGSPCRSKPCTAGWSRASCSGRRSTVRCGSTCTPRTTFPPTEAACPRTGSPRSSTFASATSRRTPHSVEYYLSHQAVAHVLSAVANGEPARDSSGNKVPWSDLRASDLTNNLWNRFAQVRTLDTSPRPR